MSDEEEKKLFTNPDAESLFEPIQPEKNPFMDPIENFFIFLVKIIFSPILFFKSLKPYEHKLSHALSFALIINWLGVFFKYLWDKSFNFLPHTPSAIEINGFIFNSSSHTHNPNSPILAWMNDVWPILLNPFLTLFQIYFSSFMIYIAARLFIPNEKLTRVDRQLNFESITKIICFAMAPMIFYIIPMTGSSIAFIYSCVLTVLGIYYCFEVNLMRALIISFFPILLLFTFFAIASLALLTLVVGFLFSFFYLFL